MRKSGLIIKFEGMRLYYFILFDNKVLKKLSIFWQDENNDYTSGIIILEQEFNFKYNELEKWSQENIDKSLNYYFKECKGMRSR